MKKKILFIIIITLIALPPVFAFPDDSVVNFKLNSIELLSDESGFDMDAYEKWYNWHKVTGYAAIGLGLAAGVLNPKTVSEDIHCAVGYAASGMSAVSLGTGAVTYGMIGNGVGDGLKDPHVILGILGGLLMVSSSVMVDVGGHEAAGALGTVLMGASVVLLKI